MEPCATSHYWARELMKQGHVIKLMPPAYVKPYISGARNQPHSRADRYSPRHNVDDRAEDWDPLQTA